MTVKTTPEALSNLQRTLRATTRATLTPAPRLQLSEWANENRVLSRESSPEPGLFRWQRAPYMKEMLDVAGDYRVQRMVIMSSAQVGKTTVIENIIAFYIANDPAPILCVLPELTTAKAFSTDRLDPMIRDTAVLKGKVKEKRSKDSGNTLLQKRFLGGHLTIIGANSASGLRSRPIRVLLMDEVDAYPVSAGKEGDPVNLAVARTSNFWNRKIILTSTPTVKDLSRIEKEFNASDQRYYHVPCPHCHAFDKLTWERIRWTDHNPDTTYCICLKCGGVIEEADKLDMMKAGVWIAENPSSSIVGFPLSALYSPWRTWKELVAKWLEDKKNPETLKVFINTILGQTWDDQGERVEAHHLAARLETFTAEVPDGVGLITAGVDVQGNRLEAYVWGWGHREESWLLDTHVIDKDPGRDEAWADLALYLRTAFKTAHGSSLPIARTAIDTGHQTENVMRFVNQQRRMGLNIIPVKGSTVPDFPLFRRTKTVYSVGTNTAKDLIFSRLGVTSAGPGFVHISNTVPVDVLHQLTAERRVTKYQKGRAYLVWENPRKERNEALDCFVYALVALNSFGVPTVNSLKQMAERHSKPVEMPTSETPSPVETHSVPEPPEIKPAPRPLLRRRQGVDPFKSWSQGF